MESDELAYEGKTFVGRGRTLDEAFENAAHQSVVREDSGPTELRLIDLRVTVVNPITEYRAIFIPVD
jgi:hypothetical protein